MSKGVDSSQPVPIIDGQPALAVILNGPQGPSFRAFGMSAQQSLALLAMLTEEMRFRATEERLNADRRITPVTLVPEGVA